MMKRITTFLLFILLAFTSKAGIVIGYQGGFYTPSIANTRSTMYYYNKVYGADFRYTNFFSGVFIGLRYDLKDGWISIAWNHKQNTFTSEYLNNSEKYKLSIRTRMNELVIDGGLKYKKWGFGIGFNMANFDVLTKRGKLAEFDVQPWGHEYGAPLKLFGFPDYPGFSVIIERYIGYYIILRGTYHFGIGEVKTWTDYMFKPNDLTLAFLINLRKNKH